MTTILYSGKNGNVCIRNKHGRIESVPAPPFRHEQIVRTSSKHYSQKSFTMVLQPTWNETRGWIYGERYISPDGTEGGTGWWNNAELYEYLTDSHNILLAERLQLERKKKRMLSEIKQIETQLNHLNYSLSLLPEEKARCQEKEDDDK
jgi:hypothetical protein